LTSDWWNTPLVQEYNCCGKEHEIRSDDGDDDNDGDICNLFTFASNKISHSPGRQYIAVLHTKCTLCKLDSANKIFLTSEGSKA
jgi:hypothetical protein